MTEEKIVEEEEEEVPVHWSMEPDANPEAVLELKTLNSKMKSMLDARPSIDRRQAIRMIAVTVYIIFLSYILYMSIGNPYSSYSFIFCATGIIICLDDLSLARRLGKLMKGEKVE